MSLFITGDNGFSFLNNLGTINVLSNLTITAGGKVEVDPTSRTKGFPSIEGYAYRMVGGQVKVQVLFTIPEQDPGKLNKPMTVFLRK